jgi:hypothetical protein
LSFYNVSFFRVRKPADGKDGPRQRKNPARHIFNQIFAQVQRPQRKFPTDEKKQRIEKEERFRNARRRQRLACCRQDGNEGRTATKAGRQRKQ